MYVAGIVLCLSHHTQTRHMCIGTHRCGMSIHTYCDNWSDVSVTLVILCQCQAKLSEEFTNKQAPHQSDVASHTSCVNFYDVIGSPLCNIKWLEEGLGCIRLPSLYLSHSCHVSQCIKKPVTQTLQKYL